MESFIAFLRGINVSGQKKIKMADLRDNLQEWGFISVQTYIQSGNLIFKSTTTNKATVARQIKKIILDDLGFEVPTLVVLPEEISMILENNPFFGTVENKNLYFTLLYTAPSEKNQNKILAEDYPNEDFHITDQCVYLNCKLGAGKAKLNNNIIERKLGVTATTRNLRTLQKLVQLAEEI